MVAEALVDAGIGRWFPEQELRLGEDDKVTVPVKHTTFEHFRRWSLLENPLESYQFLTTVRNPFDFWVSEYTRHRTRWIDGLGDPNSHIYSTKLGADMVAKSQELDFGDWLSYRWSRFGRKHRQFLHPQFTRDADRVLRFERLAETFAEWLQSLGITETVTLPVKNVTERKRDYREYYDDDARHLVERIFAPYLDRFGYAF